MTTTDHEGLTMTTDSLLRDALRCSAHDRAGRDVQRVEIAPPHLSAGDAIGKLLGKLAGTAIAAWELMLIAGAVHSHHPAVPAISYWIAVLLLFAAGLVGSAAGVRPIPIASRPRKPRR